VPSAAHVLYIPGIMLFGIAVGFVLGARAARAEAERAKAHKKR
jgi:hypothetical protein